MTEVCEMDMASRSIVGGSDSPPDLESLCQVSSAMVPQAFYGICFSQFHSTCRCRVVNFSFKCSLVTYNGHETVFEFRFVQLF